jgi:hypothetical protein
MTDPIALEALAEIAHGSAYVVDVRVSGAATVVRLAFPHGRDVEVALPLLPAATVRTDGLARPFAVQVRGGADGPTCSVLTRPDGGPVRVEIGLAEALALAGAGVHTVFTTA